MNPAYFSFLLCFHQNITNIYYNGVPVGVIKDGVFHIHQFVNADGSLRDLKMNDLVNPCPFDDAEELKETLIKAIQSIEIKSLPKPNIISP